MTSPQKKSFFSGLSGVVTGIAGLATGSAALFGVAVSQGWIGEESKTANAGRGTAGAPGSAADGADGAERPEFTVSPTRVSFESLGSRQATVTVKNTGDVEFDVEEPTIDGPDASLFEATTETCSQSVGAGRSCTLQVTFTPKTGTFDATLVVEVDGAAKAVEVPIEAQGLL